MSLKIEITAHPDFGDLREQIEVSMRALGFTREVGVTSYAVTASDIIDMAKEYKDAMPKPYEETGIDEAIDTQDAGDYQPGDEVQVEPEETQRANNPPARERGKPSPGKRKRTAAEVAEDERYEHQLKEAQDRQARDEVAAISTGDERVGPEDDAAVAEADAADEAAEAEATSKGELTLDDLRAAMGRYQKKFGMAAATTDIPALLGCAPAQVPADQIGAAIAKIDEVMGREVEKAAEPVASKDDVVKAMLAYVAFADGDTADPTDATTMPKANEDFGKLFTMVFGSGITKLSHIPATPEAWGKTLAGIQEMRMKDPFGRRAK